MTSEANFAVENEKKDGNMFEKISDDVLVSIIAFNIDHVALKAIMDLKTVNKQFYNALNPNNGAVNMIWKEICRIKYPNTPQSLKIKRWDQFLKYRMIKIIKHKKNNDDFKIFSENDPQDSVIVNCTNDIEEINNNLYSLSSSDGFQGDIGSNFLPKGYEWKLDCPVLSNKLKKIDKQTKYCAVCKKNVYIVHTEKELKERVENEECVSMTIYSGISYKKIRRHGKKGKVKRILYQRDVDGFDPYKDRRNKPEQYKVILKKYYV